LNGLTQYALVATAVGTALFHTLIPDHWLPFVLIGRARGWSAGRTSLISGFSAVVHTALSFLLGVAAVALGQASAETLGHALEHPSHFLLVVFGVLYAVWAWRKGGHFHPGGVHAHGGEPDRGCRGDEGDSGPEHLHYHADVNLIRGRTDLQAWWLAFIIGANPCLLLMPLIVNTVPQGPGPVFLVTLAYSVPTVLLMVGLSALGVSGVVRLQPPGAARHMEAASGLLVAILGIVLWIWG